MIHVTIRTLDSQNYGFDLEEVITVLDFKQKISEKLNIPQNQQRLIFKGKVLQDEKLLADYNPHDQVIHLVERPPPSHLYPSSESLSNPPNATSAATPTNPSQVFMGTVDLPFGVNFDMNNFENALNQFAHNLTHQTNSITNSGNLQHVIPPSSTISNITSPPVSFSKTRLENIQKMLKEAKTNISELQKISGNNSHLPSTSYSVDNQESPDNVLNRSFENRPKTDSLADMLQEYGNIVKSLDTHIPEITQSLRENNLGWNQAERENIQNRFERFSRILHFLSHAQHSLSDLVVDFSETEPRYLRAAVLHQEVIPVEITMPFTRGSNLPRRQHHHQPFHHSTRTDNTNTEAQTVDTVFESLPQDSNLYTSGTSISQPIMSPTTTNDISPTNSSSSASTVFTSNPFSSSANGGTISMSANNFDIFDLGEFSGGLLPSGITSSMANLIGTTLNEQLGHLETSDQFLRSGEMGSVFHGNSAPTQTMEMDDHGVDTFINFTVDFDRNLSSTAAAPTTTTFNQITSNTNSSIYLSSGTATTTQVNSVAPIRIEYQNEPETTAAPQRIIIIDSSLPPATATTESRGSTRESGPPNWTRNLAGTVRNLITSVMSSNTGPRPAGIVSSTSPNTATANRRARSLSTRVRIDGNNSLPGDSGTTNPISIHWGPPLPLPSHPQTSTGALGMPPIFLPSLSSTSNNPHQHHHHVVINQSNSNHRYPTSTHLMTQGGTTGLPSPYMFMSYNDPMLPCISHHFVDFGGRSSVAIQPIRASFRRPIPMTGFPRPRPTNITSHPPSSVTSAAGPRITHFSARITTNANPDVAQQETAAATPAPLSQSAGLDGNTNAGHPSAAINQNPPFVGTFEDSLNQLNRMMPPGLTIPPNLQNIFGSFLQRMGTTGLENVVNPSISISQPTGNIQNQNSGGISTGAGPDNFLANFMSTLFPTLSPSTGPASGQAQPPPPPVTCSNVSNYPPLPQPPLSSGTTSSMNSPNAMNFLGALMGQFIIPSSSSASSTTNSPNPTVYDFLSRFTHLFPDLFPTASSGEANNDSPGSTNPLGLMENDILSRLITYLFRNTDFPTIQQAFARRPEGLAHLNRLVRRFIKHECDSNSSFWATSMDRPSDVRLVPAPNITEPLSARDAETLNRPPTKEQLVRFIEAIVTELQMSLGPALEHVETLNNIDILETLSNYLRGFIVSLLIELYDERTDHQQATDLVSALSHGARQINRLLCSVLANPSRDVPSILRAVLIDSIDFGTAAPTPENSSRTTSAAGGGGSGGGEFLTNLVLDWMLNYIVTTAATSQNDASNPDHDINFLLWFHVERFDFVNDGHHRPLIASSIDPTVPVTSSSESSDYQSTQSLDGSYRPPLTNILGLEDNTELILPKDKRKVEMDVDPNSPRHENNKKQTYKKPEDDSWRKEIPTEWVAIIEHDIQTSSSTSNSIVESLDGTQLGNISPDYELTSEFRFSDAYINGMPQKKRRMMEALQTTALTSVVPDTYIRELFTRAVNKSDLDFDEREMEQISSYLMDDRTLMEAFYHMIADKMKEAIAKDPDYDPSKFPDIQEFLNHVDKFKDMAN